jgi:DNA-binding MarR family transcriptional regulator
MQGPPNRSSVDDAAAAILESVPLAMRAIRARMREGRPVGLSVAQFRALLHLRRRPGSGLSEIADHLGTSVPAASELVSRLVRQGLIVRETDPAERRRIRLTLSTAGTAQLDEAQRAAMQWLRSLVEALEPGRRRALVEALTDLRRLIQAVEEPVEPRDGSAEPAEASARPPGRPARSAEAQTALPSRRSDAQEGPPGPSASAAHGAV